MSFDRRNFLGLIGAGAASAAISSPLVATPSAGSTRPVSAEWDVSWVERVTGSLRGVFDAPEISEGDPVFRAIAWKKNYAAVYGTKPTEMSAVLVLRHNAVPMIMNDAFWARFGLGKELGINNPGTDTPVTVNPFRTTMPGTPPAWADFHLEAFQADRGIVLACHVAFSLLLVPRVAKAENLSPEAADARAREYVLPGVILQPSGVFAAMRAQQAGCSYIIAS